MKNYIRNLVHQISLKITVFILGALLGLKKFLVSLSSLLLIPPLRLAKNFFLKYFFIKFYKIYLRCKKYVFQGRAWKQRKFSNILREAQIVSVVILIIALGVFVNNYQARGAAPGTSGQAMLIASLVETEEKELTEKIMPLRGLASSTAVYQPEQLYAQALAVPAGELILETENIAGLAFGGGNVMKPHLISDKESRLAKRTKIETYSVKPGDTISDIAEMFGISVNTILWENNLSAYSLIRPGNQLTILPVSGVRHQTAKGETLASIAKKYKVEISEIIEANKLADSSLQIGQKLMIPGGSKYYAPASRTVRTIQKYFAPGAAAPAGKLIWPTTSTRLTQYFTWRHNGLDIGAKSGSNIYAAESGTIVERQWRTGYGYQVLVDHGGGMKTRYGHMSKFADNKVGDKVERGEVIGYIGSTGWSTGPHLHFEVMVNGARKNPLSYLR